MPGQVEEDLEVPGFENHPLLQSVLLLHSSKVRETSLLQTAGEGVGFPFVKARLRLPSISEGGRYATRRQVGLVTVLLRLWKRG